MVFPSFCSKKAKLSKARILTITSVKVLSEQVEVTTKECGVKTYNLVKYKDGTCGFIMSGVYYDTNKDLRSPSELLV